MLDRGTIERALQHSGDARLLIGLSGGGDSVALLYLLVEHLGAERLRAVVIDHGMRAGSAADARRAAGFAEALGVHADVRPALWGEGGKRTQAGARTARYRALCAAADASRVLMLAHTADDQAETVFMRARAASAWRGLAGMAAFAPAPVWPEGRGLAVARPLLSARRAALRDDLRARSAEWLEDPANANTAYERVRVRARLAELDAAGFVSARLGALATRLRTHAEELDAQALALIQHAASFTDGEIRLDASAWAGDAEARQRALSVLVTAAAGAQREPAPAAVARLEARMQAPSFRGASLGGARVFLRRGLVIGRDPGALLGRAGGPKRAPAVPLAAAVETVWDGRLSLTAATPGWSVEPGPGGAPVLTGLGRTTPISDAAPRWLIAERARALLGALD